ncbi:MAG: apolipoprotein N-acyltransferase [Myxococcales bacterium]
MTLLGRARIVTPVFRPKKLLPLGLATASGILYFVGFIGFDQWYLAWICLAPLLLALRGARTGRQALLLSWWMGFVTHLGGYYWIVHLLRTFASLSLPLAFAGYLLLCIAQGALLAVFGWLAWKLQRRTGISLGWTAPVAFVATEFAFPLLFPSYLANSQAWVPQLTQVADIGGVLLLSGIMALFSSALAEVIAARLEKRPLPRALPIAAVGALVFDLAYGAVRIPQMEKRDAAAPKLKTAIVQANVGAGDKHLRASEGIRRFKRMTDEAMQSPDLGLVVWPESALNRTVIGTPNLTGQVASEVKVPMIVGALRGEPGDKAVRRWNSVFAVDKGGAITGHYDKIKLLMFGEYVPGEKLLAPIYEKILPFTSTFQRGTTYAPLEVGGYKLSADVCYEDILPRLIRDLMGPIDEAGTRPHAMVNVTNDSWYGPAEPPIHLALATFRSIEHRRWLVRSTATGISAFIDSSGRLVQKSGFETAETLVADVPMVAAGPTVYGVVGDILGWLALAASLAGLVQRRLRPAQAASAEERRRKAA